jgi:hypothetical protein
VAAEDHNINPDLQRLMAERAKAKTTVVKSSHVPMLAQPKSSMLYKPLANDRSLQLWVYPDHFEPVAGSRRA